jgi:hypothetical protein
MTVPADGDPGMRPVSADATDQPAQVTADLLTGRRLAGPQQARAIIVRARTLSKDAANTVSTSAAVG